MMRGPLAFRKLFLDSRERSVEASLLEQPSETMETEKGLYERRGNGWSHIITELTFFMNDITFDGNILRDFFREVRRILCVNVMKDCPFTIFYFN
jgi:hypothetical protein